ncbi:hypothetical protein VPH13_12805 [Stenotrophomonas pavanii]|uniref:hypothetical protein n=1 Tax=Stenotrophomonas pavanii TaxID=487698 RepID=UPI002DBC264F|nr:hypothetical protein [Stenotrophomonas pavanii]MEC4339595.1 hypothetical protein [Stenotrophomonas pavanii]
MATEQDGWVGIKVRHTDGREGSIVGQYAGFLHLGLSIRCSDGTDARVQLNANGRDTGEAGWEWWCSNFSNGPCWLPLGDQPAR